VRIIPLRGPGVAWYKCPACRLKCRPSAVGAEGACPRCGHSHMMRLSFGGRGAASEPPSGGQN
jgi:DNA-directed RNA polymerase subunit RPC12/RpoP